jgi:hypothetical protein
VLDSVLNREFFSAMLEVEARESVSALAKPFDWDEVVDRELASVLKREFFSARPEVSVNEPVSDRKIEDFSANPINNASEPLSDLKREFFSEMPDAIPIESARNLPTLLDCEEERENEPIIDRKNEFFTAGLEAEVSDPFRVLKREFRSEGPEPIVSEELNDLNREFFSASPVADPSELLKSLLTLLLWDVVSEIESDRDLNKEFFSARLEAIVQVAVRVIEQERRPELHVSCPESTLATILPIVIEIESARAL